MVSFWSNGMEITEAFGAALKRIRLKKGLTQEDFGIVSSRTYISSLERGTKKVSFEKACELAEHMGVHPLSLFAECFLIQEKADSLDDLIQRIMKEINEK
jgi:transcriptional regulator with XRE-family HTH domain